MAQKSHMITKFPNTISSEKNLYRYVFLSYPFPPVHLSLYTDIHFHARHLHMYTFVCACVCVLEYRNAEKADNESDVFKWEDGGGQAVLLEYRNAENDPVHDRVHRRCRLVCNLLVHALLPAALYTVLICTRKRVSSVSLNRLVKSLCTLFS
jgi:hypothetical protein